MKSNSYLIRSLFLESKSSRKFLLGVVLGFGFSISVILSTMGLMDGFDLALKQGLKKSHGDLTISSLNGFFNPAKLKDQTDHLIQVKDFSSLVQIESFLSFDDQSRGVILRGVDQFYSTTVGQNIHLNSGEVSIGKEIATSFNIKIGDEIVLTLINGNKNFQSLPGLYRFKVKTIIDHGIYQKDSRLVYLNIDEVQNILDLRGKVNLVTLNLASLNNEIDQNYLSAIQLAKKALDRELKNEFRVKPFWKEYDSLIEAVQVEKVMIGLILQLVVVISIFNILAFIMFINEQKAKEIFLIKALGVSQKRFVEVWFKLISFIWMISLVVAIGLVNLFQLGLKYLPFFELPAEVYYMPRLSLHLTWQSYLIVFFGSFVWLNLITWFLFRRLKKKSLLEGLRQEFS